MLLRSRAGGEQLQLFCGHQLLPGKPCYVAARSRLEYILMECMRTQFYCIVRLFIKISDGGGPDLTQPFHLFGIHIDTGVIVSKSPPVCALQPNGTYPGCPWTIESAQ